MYSAQSETKPTRLIRYPLPNLPYFNFSGNLKFKLKSVWKECLAIKW